MSRGLVLLLCITLLPGTAGAWKAKDSDRDSSKKLQTTRQTANRKNLGWDQRVGSQIYEEQIATLRKKGTLIDNDAAMVSRLNTIMNRLKPHTLISEIPFRVHYADHKLVNAVCYLGGGILFFRGLFDPEKGLVNPKGDDEIAAVMGHEMAHATLRHSYKSYRKAMVLSIFGTIASTVIGAAGGTDWSRLFDAVFDLGTGLYFPSYSRKNESAADLEGMYTMIGAGYDPQKAIALWERASQKKGSRDHSSIFASHPSNGQRARDLARHLENIRTQSQVP